MCLSRPSLFQPVGAGLKKKLILVGVRIGCLGSIGQLPTTSSTATLVNNNNNNNKVNTILEELTLCGVTFVRRNAVHVLWHLTGLRILNIQANRYEDSLDDDNGDIQPGHDWMENFDRAQPKA
jgi:hypothetical protein